MGGTAGVKGHGRHLEKFPFPLCPLGLSVGCAQHVVPGHRLAVALGGIDGVFRSRWVWAD